MALLHRATLTPTKLEVLQAWVPQQDWCPPLAGPLTMIGGYRFDDPKDEIGIETLLATDGTGLVVQVPLTYRGAPLEGAEGALVATMQHSVLGERWIYDGTQDPVALEAFAAAIEEGQVGAIEIIEVDGMIQTREPSVIVAGSGGSIDDPLRFHHVLEAEQTADGAFLTGTWDGQDEPVVLVST
ncbi:hypothetical protein NPS01_41670 [Nocardioides psychrotolerans]|uniref:Maltokinase N-terminal cap domain-containing protein n=1 Tax=Nocardioides psychrotolerans TaxID=1005945 RepID=A0A1I3REN1_9ACTN|nr:hypothetical protein [Nocardioides psychrotolerans]GEP40504.1 hypothetical protein NPS01_41670 [Nocardioides psychrotolerans]SFJ45084.1 hypothetical protein SAMN05216561_1326 [Nocardioides psychrotolerans]